MTDSSPERLLDGMREQVRRFYASTGHLPPSVPLKPGRRPVVDILAAAVGASTKGLAHMCGSPHKLTATIGPRNQRRIADAFTMTTDELVEVLKYLTGGRYPAEKTFVVQPGEETPILSSTNVSVRSS